MTLTNHAVGKGKAIGRLSAGEALDLTLVLPTFQEGGSIAHALAMFTEVLSRRPEISYEIIVVDDDSPDQTWRIAEVESERNPHIRVIRRTGGERGLATAVVAGWQNARGELLAVMDADLQHPPELLLGMLDALVPEVDLVAGSRHIAGGGVSDWSFRRRIISRAAQLLGLLILPRVLGRVYDPMSGCFIVRRQALANCRLRPRGYKILIEVLARANLGAVKEVPYVFCERRDGESKATLRVYADYLLQLVQLRVDSLRESSLLNFALIGLSGLIIDMGLLYLLSDPGTLGWSLTPAKFAAAECAVLNNFGWHDRWTYRRELADGGPLRTHLGKRLLKFQMVCAVGMLLGVGLLNAGVGLLGANRYAANLAAIGVAGFWNSFFSRKLGWRSTAP